MGTRVGRLVAAVGVGVALAALAPSCSSSVEVVSGPPPGAPRTRPSASAWPVAMRDARLSGQAAVDGPTTGRLRWVRRLEGNVTPGPVLARDGTIYLASNAGILHALDPRTGKDRWTLDSRTTTGGDLSTSPAVLDSDVSSGRRGLRFAAYRPPAGSCGRSTSVVP